MSDDARLHLISHHPRSGEDDALGFSDYARTVCEILTGLTAECTGLTVGIFGDWGSGKSTVLKMIGELLTPQKPGLRRRSKITSVFGPGFPREKSEVISEQVLSVRLRRRLRRLRGLWYRFLGRISKKGKRLESFRMQWQKAEHIEPRLYRPLVVKFNAWEYGKDQVWVALLRTIIKTTDESLWPWQTTGIRLRLWVRRVQWSKLPIHFIWIAVRIFVTFLLLCTGLWLVREAGQQLGWLNQLTARLIVLLNLSLAQPLSLPPQAQGWLEQLTGWLQAALGLFSLTAGIWGLFSTLVKSVWQGVRWVLTVRLSLPSNLLRPALDKDLPYAVEQFRQELLDLIQVIGRRRPIVVLMDDLDRAPIDQIAPVLEAIKHFGVEPDTNAQERLNKRRAPIAFVFAADRGVIQHAIASYYKDFWATLIKLDTERFAREYLEKIVQISLELPPLSSSHLSNLFREEPGTSPEKRDGIWTLASARQQARVVFVQGPKENPRQVIQAYNTFQAFWRVVQQRRLQEIEPKLLAALILVRYVWPEVFELFFRYPEFFFDLHALTTKELNELCPRTEIEELLSLGCPVTEHTPMIELVRHEHPDLLRLLGPLHLHEQLGVNQLLAHLTLIKDQIAPTGIHLVESGTALLSGDPSLIKFADRTNPQVRQERLPWLMEFLEFKSSTAESRLPANSRREDKGESTASGDRERSAEAKMVRALFALGRIRDGRGVEPIKKIVDARIHSKAVVERAIFALAHLAEHSTDKTDKGAARRALAETLGDGETSPALRLRILRLLDLVLPRSESIKEGIMAGRDESESRRPIIHLALRDEMKFVRDAALEIAKRRGWIEEALEELNAGPQTEEAFDGYFQIVESLPETVSALSEPVREHLVELAVDNNFPHQTRAFEALANFPDAGTVVEAMAEVTVKTPDEGIRRAAIARMGELQAVPGVEWRAKAWTHIEETLADESPEVRVAFIRALGVTRRTAAVPHLERALKHPNTRVRKAAFEGLYNIADNKVDLGAAAKAQVVLDEWEISPDT